MDYSNRMKKCEDSLSLFLEMNNLTIELVFIEEKIRNNWSLIRSMLDNFQFEE